MLTCRLLSAIEAASVPLAEDMVAQLDLADKQHPEVMPHLKPLCTAIDMVFGSAAALSATFGFKVPLLLHALIKHLCRRVLMALCTVLCTQRKRQRSAVLGTQEGVSSTSPVLWLQ